MSEVSSNVKQFTISVNQQFPGGTLFLLLSDHEFKKLLMDMSSKCLNQTLTIPRNMQSELLVGTSSMMIILTGYFLKQLSSLVVEHRVTSHPFFSFGALSMAPISWSRSHSSAVSSPMDDGQSIAEMCLSVRCFMPENFTAAMATMSAIVMGANYTSILKIFGCCGVPILTGRS